jgi:hypothetical protein
MIYGRGSGFCLHPDLAGPAAIIINAMKPDRGWKAAPTIQIPFLTFSEKML